MIQTQLLKSDKPYQIITAAGMVGIQVATLIVTEEKTAADGSYVIDTHSHPVVNYGNKEGLTEELKYHNSGADAYEDYLIYCRLKPEAAVWNKVEVRDVRVLGLVGANNMPIDLEWFVSMIPSIPSEDPSLLPSFPPLWGRKTSSIISNLLFGMRGLGISCQSHTKWVSDLERDGHTYIKLKRDPYSSERFVRVQIREANEYDLQKGEIAFRVRLDEDPMEFMYTVVSCMRELDDYFIGVGANLRFVYQQASESKDQWEETLERATEHINSLMWKNRYGIG